MTQDASFMKPSPDAAAVTNHTNAPSAIGWGGRAALALAIAGAFGGVMYQSAQLSKELGTVKRQLMQSEHQIADMQGQLTTSTNEARREVSESVTKLNAELAKTRQDALANSQRAVQTAAQTVAKSQSSKALTTLAAKNTELAEQIDQLKRDNTAKSTEVDQALSGIKGDVGEVKVNVASTKADLDNTKTDLRRALGDMGVMSGLIATNGTELQELRKLGERNYIEFTLPKNGMPQKVGDVQMSLKKTDTKRSRFTLDLLADDKKIEKKDKTINEPVQFYTASLRLPYEVVINSVSKDSVKGYLAVPKVKLVAQR